jgi:hypothetical protein
MRLHRRWSEYGGAARSLHRAGHGGSQSVPIKRAGGCGIGGCGLEDRRPAPAAGSRADTPTLWAGGLPSARKLELAPVGAVRRSARGADLRGELAVLTAAEVADELAIHGAAAALRQAEGQRVALALCPNA